MKKVLAGAIVSGAALIAMSGAAGAHTGQVIATENCQAVHVIVRLDNNVSYDRTVTVTSTIPGVVSDVVGAHYDTTHRHAQQTIFTATVDSQNGTLTGDVTLTIDNGQRSEWSQTQSVTPDTSCKPIEQEPTPEPPQVEPTPTTTTSTVPVEITTAQVVDSPQVPEHETPPGELAYTGDGTLGLVLIGGALLIGGGYVVARTRKVA